MNPAMENASVPQNVPLAHESRVVIRLADRVVKGFVDRQQLREVKDVSTRLDVRPAEGGMNESILLADAKAVFFVKTFHGRNDREDLRFHDHLPPAQSLWVRLTFADGEVLEGMIENGPSYVLDPGFLLTPTDPTANNWLVYVPKTRIRRFEVLGLRQRSALKLE